MKGVLGKGKKDMTHGFLSQYNDSFDTLALAVGGRSGYGRQYSQARDEILMVKISSNFMNDIKRVGHYFVPAVFHHLCVQKFSGGRIIRTKLSYPRYGINSVTVPTNMFKDLKCKKSYSRSGAGLLKAALNVLFLHIFYLLLLSNSFK